MRLRIANREFAPQAWAALLTAAAAAAFVALGSWQLDRWHEKQAMLDSFDHGSHANVELAGDAHVDTLPRYQAVRTVGRYDPTRQILVDNMPSRQGRPGYRVLTPFVRDGASRVLLVDRGWVPLGVSRDVLPDVDVASTPRDVSGRLDLLPQPGVRVGEAGVPGDRHWPRVLNFPRQADVEAVLGQPVESRIVLLDPEAADGYERAWHPSLGFGPERHLGYAIQWFALAATVVVVFCVLSLRPITPATDPSPEVPT